MSRGSVPPLTRLCCALGRPALDTLAVQIEATKAADPFAPVTVVVATNRLGVFIRRHFGRDGIVNLDVVTLNALADRIARSDIAAADATPLRPSELAEAARAVLLDDPGPFAAFVHDPGFLRSLADALRQLARVPAASRRRLETHPGDPGGAAHWQRLRHLLALRDALDVRLANRLDPAARLEIATRRLQTDPAGGAALGTVIVYAPGPLDVADSAFVHALSTTVATTVVLALTGDPDVDRAVRLPFVDSGLLLGLDDGIPAAPLRAARQQVIVAADPEEEVRSVVRAIARRLVDGFPLHGTAVLYPTEEPYARLVHQHLTAANLPHFGPELRTLAQSATGRTLLGFLDALEHGLDRATTLGWLGSVPARIGPEARRVPVTRWAELAAAAGVTREDTWAPRLGRYAARLRADADAYAARRHGDDEPAAGRLRRDADAVDELAAWVATLQAFGDALRSAADWATAGAALRDFLVWLYGATTAPGGWEEEEKSRDERVRAVLASLGRLDAYGAAPSLTDLRRALDDELAGPKGHIGNHGDGIWFGPLADAIGATFATVFVVGAAEGSLPRTPAPDPMFAGADMLVPNLPVRDVTTDDTRAFLAVQASADEVVVTTPVVDVRSQVVCRPSPLLLYEASALARRTISSAELARLDPAVEPWLFPVASFQAGLLGCAEPLDVAERDVRAILAQRHAGADPNQLEFIATDSYRRRALAARRGLAADAWGPWSGQVGSVPAAVLDRPFSPTSLEAYVGCPRRFLFSTLLRIAEPDTPDDTGEIDARIRGAIVHEVLEEFATERLVGRPPDPLGEPDDDDIAALQAIIARVCATYAAQGRVGIAVSWAAAQRRIVRQLRDWLTLDAARRAETRTAVHAVEFAFGLASSPEAPVQVAFESGGMLRLRGKGDRVDLGDDRIVVYDYKTGSPDNYKLPEADPLDAGRRLQLPAYAAAAARLAPGASITAAYWFIGADPDKAFVTLEADDGVMRRFSAILEQVRRDLGDGIFPPHPSDGCRFCPFADICPSDRDAQWQAASASPDLAGHLRMLAGPDTEPDA